MIAPRIARRELALATAVSGSAVAQPSPAQIAALVRHIRTLCRCAQPSWAADETAP